MSFMTEYFDEYREHPIKKVPPCKPEDRWAKLEGKWLDPKMGKQDKVQTDEERKQFIKETMRCLRGQSTYFNDYCAHLDQSFKIFVPRPKPKKSKKTEAVTEEVHKAPTLAIKDTELMKMARELYEQNMDEPTLKPLDTHGRILGYVRPRQYKTGISEYQNSIARVAYELVRDDRIPRYHAHNGCRPRWGYPPEGTRQPELDGAPYDGERLY